MKVIENYIPDFHGKKTTINGYEGYKNGDAIYFIIPKPNNEVIHYEQKAVSDYLLAKGFEIIATPILNQQGQLSTQVEQQEYLVYQGQLGKVSNRSSHAKLLASFHQLGADYPYAPSYISSYGQWKQLWQMKIDSFEQVYNQQIQERPVSRYQRLFINTFPYIVGLSENALQYLQETESEHRFHTSDQASITFQRYTNQLQQEIVWSHELTYDHPVRDVAEYIRPYLLEDEYQSITKCKTFLSEYEQVRSFSIFGWRLLYARLLFPVHLFDFLEEGLIATNHEKLYKDYKIILEKHANYENNLKNFYNTVGIDASSINIPILDW